MSGVTTCEKRDCDPTASPAPSAVRPAAAADYPTEWCLAPEPPAPAPDPPVIVEGAETASEDP